MKQTKEERSAVKRTYYLANKDKILARQKQVRDPVRQKEYSAAHYAANKERVLAKQKLYDARRSEAQREKERVTRAASQRMRAALDREAHNKKSRAYYEANRLALLEKSSVRSKRHYEANKEAYRARDARHKAEMRAQYAGLTECEKWMLQEAHHLARLRERVCGGKWEVDHIKALANGGVHHPLNVQVVPRFFNRSKGTAHSSRFFGAQE